MTDRAAEPAAAPTAGLDPVVASEISGWAEPGAEITVLVDGKRVATPRASARRQFVLRPPPDPCCGFAVAAPESLFDGGEHEVRACGADGRDLPGSPLRFRAGAAEGTVEGFRHGLLFGTFRAGASGEAPIVAALMGDEVLARATVRDDGGVPRFAIPIPPAALASGHRLVRVAVQGSNSFLKGSPFALPVREKPVATLRERQRPLTAAIKISAPNMRVAHEWGDYHFAVALGAALERRGWSVRVDCNEDWGRTGDDVAIALRGRHRYPVDPRSINLLWIISHPDRMAAQELDDYAHVFVASDIHAAALKPVTRAPVGVLHQCADPGVFFPPPPGTAPSSRVLFVGNSRREYRTMVKWCVEQDIDADVFGSLWDGLIPPRFVRGTHIGNTDLHRWYGSGAIVLNDHWDTMRENGFLSNRLFDASAAGGFTITDPVKGLAKVFGDAIETAASAEELKRKVDHFLAHPQAMAEKAARARAIVLAGHTFDNRADRMVEVVRALREGAVRPLARPNP